MDRFFFGFNDSLVPYSWFHWSFLALFVVGAVLLLVFCRKCSDKTFRIIVGVAWGVIVLFEIGKQINWAMDLNSRTWVGLQLDSFPFQFCSLPFYLWPFTVFLKESKYRNALNLFIGTYVFFAGFGYMFVASSLVSRIFISHQTMIHHGLQAVICLFVFVHEYKKFSYKMFLQCSIFLVFTVIAAIGLNVALSQFGHINLCELNPIYPTEAPVFGDILKATNFPTFVIIYLIGFFGFGNITYWSEVGIIELIHLIDRKYKAKKEAKAA